MKTARSTQKLPAPRTDSMMSLEATLAARHTVRKFKPDALTIDELGQLLWSAQGVTHEVTHPRVTNAGALPIWVERWRIGHTEVQSAAWITALTKIRYVGLCHSVQGTAMNLADYIGVPIEGPYKAEHYRY